MEGKKRIPADARKRQIASSALLVFAKEGFDGATTRKLAEAAGVSEALLYRHFPTKEALYGGLVSVFSERAGDIPALLTRSKPGTGPLVETVYSLTRLILLGAPGRPKDDTVDRLVGQSLLGDGTFAAGFLSSLFEPLVPYLSACLRAAWAEGDLQALEGPPELPCYLMHHLAGAVALFRLPGRPLLPTDDPETLFRQTVLFSCRGLGLTSAALDRHLDFDRLDRSFVTTLTPPTPHEDS
ncbi:MAG: TetR/AcrR family transcriptional regulator [Armatimonadetes bacterium]|nr:TetR/AcrR family transcriptional regulator [Armatimonadota bacterium]